jgi:hypothetical protein
MRGVYSKRWSIKNAKAYVPLPQATRRRVSIGLYVIHFLLCDFPALGRAFLKAQRPACCAKVKAFALSVLQTPSWEFYISASCMCLKLEEKLGNSWSASWLSARAIYARLR